MSQSAFMIMDVLSEGHQTEHLSKSKKRGVLTQQAQEIIYQFLLEMVKQKPPAKALLEFRHLYFDYEPSPVNEEAFKALSRLVLLNNENEFRHTLKRSCYILVNNWDVARNYGAIKELVELFANFKINKRNLSLTLNRIKLWIGNFVNGQDYYELKLFISKHGYSEYHWSNRYTSYLLVPQYTNLNNPVEQREAARTLSKKLKDQFKFDLAMYTARFNSPVQKDKILRNPTSLGDEVLRFIKMIVVKRGSFSYKNLAHIFIEQTRDLSYKEFKYSLKRYLIFSVGNKDSVELLNQKLSEKLEDLYESYHEEQLNEALLLRTCNKVVDYLTTEEQNEPSALFILLLSQGNPITLVIVLLKIVFICSNVRTHLENSIAKLILYYMDYPEDECKWVINFFEIFKITFAIHADNVQYNLIKMSQRGSDDESEIDLDSYRVFSQRRELESKNASENGT